MRTSGWGRFPSINENAEPFSKGLFQDSKPTHAPPFIARGCGKSYGDSALAQHMCDMTNHKQILHFDERNGQLHCQSGVLIADILEQYLPQGWLLPVMPGTKYITIGGAIAADIHGKNHYKEGCFSESIIELTLFDIQGKSHTCSPEKNPDLFHSSCGGMGLTGIIDSAILQLKPVTSQYIEQSIVKTANLKETLAYFKHYQNHDYCVAWLDCFSQYSEIGRGVFEAGQHSRKGGLSYKKTKRLSLPFHLPFQLTSWLINRASMKTFNTLYLAKAPKHITQKTTNLDGFLFPLDYIQNWNLIYGHKGFLQYQIVLPVVNSEKGISALLHCIKNSQETPTLAVLKSTGEVNANLLSFPLKGFALAIDFKIKNTTLGFLYQLDKIVLEYGGRVYLAKDARAPKAIFDAGYPNIERFRHYREQQNFVQYYASQQSQRLSL